MYTVKQAQEILKAEPVDLFEKAHKVGDVHPNGKYVWTEYKPGKFDWRITTAMKTLNQWYRQDKQVFTRLESTYGNNISSPFSPTSLRPLAELNLPKGIKVVYQQCFLGTFKDNDGSTVDVRSIPWWIEVSDDKCASIRNDNEKIIPLSFSAEWDKTGNPAYIYAVYNIDADKLDIKDISKRAEKSFDDLFGDAAKDKGMKLINKFLKTINPRHKNI